MPPSLSTDFNRTILYLVVQLRAADSILVYRDKKKAKAVVIGIQITIAGTRRRNFSGSGSTGESTWDVRI
jgi:hypothetical protein